MISPQEPSRGGMSNEEYARVMTGEKYWREHIAKEIEAEEFARHDLQHSFWKTINDQTPIEQMAAYLNGVKAAADIARGGN